MSGPRDGAPLARGDSVPAVPCLVVDRLAGMSAKMGVMSQSVSASQGRWLREAYRRDLGIEPHQRLVAVATAADGHSLWTHHPALVELLLAELPMDEYRVVFLPDADTLGSVGRMVSLMRRHLENGLVMLETSSEDWPGVAAAAVRAADCLIGDHSQTSLRAAELGVPTAPAAFDVAVAAAGSRLRALGDQSPAFHMGGDRRAQVEALCASGLLPVEDPEPAAAAPTGLVPVEHCRPTTAWWCEASVDTENAAVWSRYPADLVMRQGPGHLVADVRCLDIRARDRADVMVRSHEALPETEAHAEAWALLAEQPLAQVAAVRVGDREMLLASESPHRTVHASCRPEHTAVAASIWLAAGRPEEGQWRLTGPGGNGLLRVTARA
jgi:hypothetical protein